MAKVSKLDILIGAKDRTKRAFSSVTGAMKKMKGAAKAAGLAVAAVGAGLFMAMKKTVDFADKIGKTADRIGLATGELQKLRFAFDIGGMSAEVTDKALDKFSRNLGEARKHTGTLDTFLRKLGEKGFGKALLGAKSITGALKIVFDRMRKAGNQSDAAAISVAAFGRQGSMLAAIARKGGAEFVKWTRRAEELGLVLSDKMVRSAEALKDKFTILEYQIRTAFMKAVLNYGPQLEGMLDGLIKLVFKATQAVIKLGKKWGLIELGAADFRDQMKANQKRIDAFRATNKKILKENKEFKKRISGSFLKPEGRRSQTVKNLDVIKLLEKENEELAKKLAKIKAISEQLKSDGKGAGGGTAPDQVVISDKIRTAFEKEVIALKAKKGMLNELMTTEHGSIKLLERHSTALQNKITIDQRLNNLSEKGIELTIREELEYRNLWTAITALNEKLSEKKKKLSAVKKATEDNLQSLKDYAKASKNVEKQLSNMAVSGLQKMEDALIGLMNRTMSVKEAFSSMATSIIQDIQRILIRKHITGQIAAALDASFGGTPAPSKQHGGPVTGGRPYMVGEAGPELFIPRNSGQIVPNGAGGVNVVNNYDFSGANPATIQALRQESERIKQETFSSVFSAVGRGGAYARAVGKR